jgi:hypothetical protein
MIPPSLRAVWEAPPRAYSPAPIWWWSGEPLDRRRLRWQLERFTTGGVHNLVILNLAPSGPMFGADADAPAFFSDAWWELLDGVCADAAELGVSLWFYDQLGFSGADLQARLVRDVPAYAGQWLEPGGGVVTRGFDYLSAAACGELLDRVHGEFERRLGHRLGNVIVGSFQDELPSLPTWTAGFAEEFARRRGYELEPRLKSLWAAGPDAHRVRRDYHLTRAELAEEAFFRPLAAWHERFGLLHGCDQQDPARAGHPVDGVQLYADYARTHRWFGAPGSDHHGDARIHSSLAHLYGRSRTWIEAFHSSGWGGTLEETFDWLLPWLRAGATLYNPHAVYYTTKAGWWEWAPPSTDWRQPYWRHHKTFADAVTRLCAGLSLGRHLCDVAVLFPTATAQAGSRLDGVDPDAAAAQRTYRELVGDMAWFRMVPGALDRLGVDADVIDDDSVQRAAVTGGRLRVADEAYSTVLLPACTVLEGATARRLAEFAAEGGRVLAVGPPPSLGVGDADADAAVARLCAVLEVVPSVADLEVVLGDVRRVVAPVPALVREVDGATVVFVTAAAPMASRVSVGRPEERGADLGWLDVTYDFDAGRYARRMPIRVRGVRGAAWLLSPFGGAPRELPATPVADGVEVVVPFDDGPAALLVFAGEPGSVQAPAEEVLLAELPGDWGMSLVPTLDDTWGDFGASGGQVLERWELEHRPAGSAWSAAQATFGPHGRHKADQAWVPTVYSDSRGIRKDPIHRAVLGPKGHVPEEFLDFGEVAAGQEVVFRSRLTVPGDGGFPAVGAAAAKSLLIDGAPVPLDDHGYLAVSGQALGPGEYDLELRLVPDEALWLRAHFAVVTDPGRYRRPEWITVAGPARPGAQVAFTAPLPDGPALLQVAAFAPCRVLVDGVEVGRQGGFDPYAEREEPRVGRYELAGRVVSLALTETDAPAAVLTDGAVVTGPGWYGGRDGQPVPVVPRRRQHGDPAALHLYRRPHPLPGASWLEGDQPEVVLPIELGEPGGEQWLRCGVPPGAVAVELAVHGRVLELLLDDAELDFVQQGTRLRAELPAAAAGSLTMRVQARRQGGAVLGGPVRFTVGPGRIELGDWETAGLAGYSGGVRYRRTVDLASPPAEVRLDLGEVRGTAEVSVNGTPVGVRVCAPYAFEVGPALRPGANEIEVLVCGTLAPYLDAVSPTHFVFEGQRRSGLFGPVRLYERIRQD